LGLKLQVVPCFVLLKRGFKRNLKMIEELIKGRRFGDDVHDGEA
jgi:hypothetical protein